MPVSAPPKSLEIPIHDPRITHVECFSMPLVQLDEDEQTTTPQVVMKMDCQDAHQARLLCSLLDYASGHNSLSPEHPNRVIYRMHNLEDAYTLFEALEKDYAVLEPKDRPYPFMRDVFLATQLAELKLLGNLNFERETMPDIPHLARALDQAYGEWSTTHIYPRENKDPSLDTRDRAAAKKAAQDYAYVPRILREKIKQELDARQRTSPGRG